MQTKTDSLIATFFESKDSDTERTNALLLVEHLRESKIPFQVIFKEINRPNDLSNETYLNTPRAIVILSIAKRHYAWDPIDRTNIDMFFTE